MKEQRRHSIKCAMLQIIQTKFIFWIGSLLVLLARVTYRSTSSRWRATSGSHLSIFQVFILNFLNNTQFLWSMKNVLMQNESSSSSSSSPASADGMGQTTAFDARMRGAIFVFLFFTLYMFVCWMIRKMKDQVALTIEQCVEVRYYFIIITTY